MFFFLTNSIVLLVLTMDHVQNRLVAISWRKRFEYFSFRRWKSIGRTSTSIELSWCALHRKIEQFRFDRKSFTRSSLFSREMISFSSKFFFDFSSLKIDIYGDQNSIVLNPDQISINTEHFRIGNHSSINFCDFHSFQFDSKKNTRIHLDRIRSKHVRSKVFCLFFFSNYSSPTNFSFRFINKSCASQPITIYWSEVTIESVSLRKISLWRQIQETEGQQWDFEAQRSKRNSSILDRLVFGFFCVYFIFNVYFFRFKESFRRQFPFQRRFDIFGSSKISDDSKYTSDWLDSLSAVRLQHDFFIIAKFCSSAVSFMLKMIEFYEFFRFRSIFCELIYEVHFFLLSTSSEDLHRSGSITTALSTDWKST